MKRWTLLLAGAALWLFLAAIPALADGGPHVVATNSGTSSLTADSCAGCHRAHTAQGEYLITAPSEEALCLTCHGAQSSGATTDVMTGVQYVSASAHGTLGTQLGALRNGGFDQARIDSDGAVRVSYQRGWEDTAETIPAISQRPKVGVAAPANVTSSHLELAANGLQNPGVAWGNGENGTGAGPSVAISCGSCHNPHGNGQFRILNPLPESDGIEPTWTIDVIGSVASNDRILTRASHALLPGDKVVIAGTPFSGTYYVNAVGNHTLVDNPAPTPDVVVPYFRVYASGTSGANLDITADSTALTGTVTRPDGVKVTDSPVTANTKNYTVQQVKGTQGDNASFWLYANQVTGGPTAGDYFHRNVPWISTADRAPITSIAGGVFTTSVPHGLTVPAAPAVERVNIGGVTGLTSGLYTVATAPTSTTFTITVATGTWTPTADAFASRFGGGSGALSVANDAPNGQPATVGMQASYSEQITAWCSSCHTRYFADRNPIEGSEPATGSAWQYPREGDSLYNHQHRTVPNRACVTCHVAHGTNAAMPGAESGSAEYPNGAVPGVTAGVANGNSRLLKIDNRGTCQACHDPTLTTVPGQVAPNGASIPSVP